MSASYNNKLVYLANTVNLILCISYYNWFVFSCSYNIYYCRNRCFQYSPLKQGTPYMEYRSLSNLCIEPLLEDIQSNGVAVDGCEVENLSKEDSNLRSRGYQVEHFVRPPVWITLNYFIPMCIHNVLICIDLKENEEAGIEVSAISNPESRWPCQKSCGYFVMRACQPYLLLGNRSVRRCVPGHVMGSHIQTLLPHKPLQLKSTEVLTRSSQLSICISKLSSHRPLWVKWIEIWGLPSSTCSKEQLQLFDKVRQDLLLKSNTTTKKTFESIPQLYGSSLATSDSSLGECSKVVRADGVSRTHVDSVVVCGSCHEGVETGANNYTTQLAEPSTLHNTNQNQTPVEYLDEITFEVMIVPMKLPSGHFVDKSTLDRSQHLDSVYGRAHCDPFTGIPFTEHHSASFCPELKAKIDQYHSDFVNSQSGKSLGSALDIEKHLNHTKGAIT